MSIDIRELTIGQAQELTEMFSRAASRTAGEFPARVGEAWVFRSVTMINLGRIVEVGHDYFVIEDAGWVADTERYGEFLKSGAIREFEPYPGKCVVMRGALVDMQPWSSPLPRNPK